MNIIKHCKIALYADDTVLYTADAIFRVSVRKMRKDMKALTHWCDKNGIRMNTDKTKLMLFGGRKQLKALPVVKIKVGDSI